MTKIILFLRQLYIKLNIGLNFRFVYLFLKLLTNSYTNGSFFTNAGISFFLTRI